MNQEIKDKLEQAAAYHQGSGLDFMAGAQTILDNPSEWGLVESSVMETCRKLRLRSTEHEAENQRLREALEKIATITVDDIAFKIAKEALKQEVNND